MCQLRSKQGGEEGGRGVSNDTAAHSMEEEKDERNMLASKCQGPVAQSSRLMHPHNPRRK